MRPLAALVPVSIMGLLLGCQSSSPAESGGAQPENLQSAIGATMADARRAIETQGPTKVGLSSIAASMQRLAKAPGLINDRGMRPIHGSDLIMRRTLASDGPDDITLYLTRITPGAKTPVHDHATWGVVCVLRGEDRHARWRRTDDGASDDHATLGVVGEQVVRTGETVYWLPPPGDIHTQEAVGEVWELVMTGCDLSHATASGLRHWFDPHTEAVSHQPPTRHR